MNPLRRSGLTRRTFLQRSARLAAASPLAAALASALPARRAEAADSDNGEVDFATRRIFDHLDLSINDGNGQKHQTNEEGVIGWQQSYIMLAYVQMYRAYREPHYLEKFLDHAHHVLQQRDSERGAADYRGVSAPFWSARRYSVDHQPVAGPVCTGMILNPFTAAARLIRATPALHRQARYRDAADRYIDAAREAIAAHDFQWRDIGDELGTYIFPKGMPMAADGIELPLNMNHAMGRPMLHMAAMTGDEVYRDRVMRMARIFKGELRVDDNDAYIWNYHWRQSRGYLGWTEEEAISANRPVYGGNRRPEDTSHGTISTDFAAMLHREGLIFGQQDLRRFANTMLHNILTTADGRMTAYRFVNASGETESRWETASGLWVVLSPWHESIYPTLHRFVHEVVGIPASAGRRSTAMLISSYFNLIAQAGPWDADADLPPRRA